MNPNKIIEKIIAMCPYPGVPEPKRSDWAEFGEKVCDLLIEEQLVDPEKKDG